MVVAVPIPITITGQGRASMWIRCAGSYCATRRTPPEHPGTVSYTHLVVRPGVQRLDGDTLVALLVDVRLARILVLRCV